MFFIFYFICSFIYLFWEDLYDILFIFIYLLLFILVFFIGVKNLNAKKFPGKDAKHSWLVKVFFSFFLDFLGSVF